MSEETELRAAALRILQINAPLDKVYACQTLQARVNTHALILDTNASISMPEQPGRPTRPELVCALDVPKRSVHTLQGRLSMLHALAHIEFNAINLALDVIVRFSHLPEEFYWDWWQVAFEEAYHFSMLREYLINRGADYGDFKAHNGLWEMAEKTRHSLAARMALVPRTLEARGLDACPVMRDKLARAGDITAAQIIDTILHDEIGHVALGNRWFLYACERDNTQPILTYNLLKEQHGAPSLHPPFNIEARRAAGFFEDELLNLQNLL